VPDVLTSFLPTGDPRPVQASQPVAALKPMLPDVLSPLTMSRSAEGSP